MVVGVDINPAYIEIARARFTTLGSRLHLVNGDVMEVELPAVPFDLVHAALLLEYVEPLSLLRRIHRWLSPEGTCSVVTQEPVPGGAEVSSSGFLSLGILAGRMFLRNAEEVVALAAEAGFRLMRQRATTLPNGKSLVNSIFEKSRRTESGHHE
jgi:ubiquinone/menaquinone biosynthesis C-methylase UbiE